MLIETVSAVCVGVVIYQISRNLYSFLYGFFIAPAFHLSTDVKKMGEWAVITGATDGVGKAYAKELAKKGLKIVLISRNKEKLQEVATEISDSYKVETKIVEADFSDGEKIFENIKEQLFGLDIGVLVNNVGLSYPYPNYFLELRGREKVYRDIVQLNIISVLAMCQIVMPGMVEKRKGVIINISSATALFPSPLLLVYGASKMFVSKFSEDLAIEYKKYGIIVQCVLPGFVATKMSKVKNASLFTPSPTKFVKSALDTVGVLSHTVGYWPHCFLPGILMFLNFISPAFVGWNVMRSMETIRAKALKKEAQT